MYGNRCYFAGYKAAYDKYKGVPLNDESYRGEFRYDVLEETKLEWHNNPISLTDLDEDDCVSITMVTGRGGITDVFKIQLLGDEK